MLESWTRDTRPGAYAMEPADRVFNPSRETARLLVKAQRIGPNAAKFAEALFTRLGRPGLSSGAMAALRASSLARSRRARSFRR